MRRPNEANREKFITAAVRELEEHGVSDFSIRRVARRCELSCAAPYKHFESREALMLEVIRHINKKWLGILESTVTGYRERPLREQIVAVCMAYLTFLCTYPEYQTIIFMNDRVFPSEMLAEKGKLSQARGSDRPLLCVGRDVGGQPPPQDLHRPIAALRRRHHDQFRRHGLRFRKHEPGP